MWTRRPRPAPRRRRPVSAGPAEPYSLASFERLAQEAVAGLPESFRGRLENIALMVAEEPEAGMCAAVGLEEGAELFGLYEGVSLLHREPSSYGGALPDRVWIFRAPILRHCRTRREVVRAIQETVVHELGHYFGLGDDEMPF